MIIRVGSSYQGQFGGDPCWFYVKKIETREGKARVHVCISESKLFKFIFGMNRLMDLPDFMKCLAEFEQIQQQRHEWHAIEAINAVDEEKP